MEGPRNAFGLCTRDTFGGTNFEVWSQIKLLQVFSWEHTEHTSPWPCSHLNCSHREAGPAAKELSPAGSRTSSSHQKCRTTLKYWTTLHNPTSATDPWVLERTLLWPGYKAQLIINYMIVYKMTAIRDGMSVRDEDDHFECIRYWTGKSDSLHKTGCQWCSPTVHIQMCGERWWQLGNTKRLPCTRGTCQLRGPCL